MTRQEPDNYLSETYGCAGEPLFARYPGFRVFRHQGNRKWFAVLWLMGIAVCLSFRADKHIRKLEEY